MIDLKPFCERADSYRDYLHQPWSRGAFTYASNGHIAIRVPRRDDVPENEKAPDVEKIFRENGVEDSATTSLPDVNVSALPKPTIKMRRCRRCRGTRYLRKCDECGGEGTLECDLGHDHECETCDSKGTFHAGETDDGAFLCTDCNGTGSEPDFERGGDTEIIIDGRDAMTLRLFILLLGLPDVKWNLTAREYPACVRFWFDGGDGLITPRRMSDGPSSIKINTKEKSMAKISPLPTQSDQPTPSPADAYTLHDKYMPAAIIRAVLEIKKTIDPAKRGEQGQDGERSYSYAGVDDIFAALQRPMAERGLILEMVAGPMFNSTNEAVAIDFQPVIYCDSPDGLVIYDNPRAVMHMLGEFTGNNTCAALRTLAEKTFLRALFKLPTAAPERSDAPREATPPHEGGESSPGGEGRKLRVLNPLTMDAETSATERAVIIRAMEEAFAVEQEKSQDPADRIAAAESTFRKHQSTWARLIAKDQQAVKVEMTRLITLAAGGKGEPK